MSVFVCVLQEHGADGSRALRQVGEARRRRAAYQQGHHVAHLRPHRERRHRGDVIVLLLSEKIIGCYYVVDEHV